MALLTDEQIIKDEFKNSLDAGRALADIRDRRLYRVDYTSFPDYYRKKWQFSVNKVHYLTVTAETYNAITFETDLPKPENAFQLRPLLGLELEKAKSAWAHAVSKAGGRKITARLVRAAVAELKFNAEAEARQAEVRADRAKRRQQLTQSMEELLESILMRKPHEELVQTASLLDRHLRYFFPKPRKRRPV